MSKEIRVNLRRLGSLSGSDFFSVISEEKRLDESLSMIIFFTFIKNPIYYRRLKLPK